MAQGWCGWCGIVSAGLYGGGGMSTRRVDIICGSSLVALGSRCGVVSPTLLQSQTCRFWDWGQVV